MRKPSRNVFAPKLVPSRDLTLEGDHEVGRVLGQAKRNSSSILAAWRMQRSVDTKNVELLNHGLDLIFSAKRKEIEHSIALQLDYRKKAALADHLADTAAVDKQIVATVQGIMEDLIEEKMTAAKQAARREHASYVDLQAMHARGEITDARFQQMVSKNEEDTERHISAIDAMTDEVVKNLGQRLYDTLAASGGPEH